ncbi:MAG TPA: rhodanese-like domain-containing protein [Chthoniobacteraceae bacterium]|nr:rhodanese-like domain-containing protein [Chthoniobacteraceae bacterium]
MSAPTPEISVGELQRLLAATQPPRLIDVREPDEWEIARIAGAELLPLSQWPAIAEAQLNDSNEPLFVLCHHGGRSARAAEFLLRNGFANVTNVAGGIDAWSREIDPAVPRY